MFVNMVSVDGSFGRSIAFVFCSSATISIIEPADQSLILSLMTQSELLLEYPTNIDGWRYCGPRLVCISSGMSGGA